MKEREPNPAPQPPRLQALALDDIEELEGLVCDPNDPDCAAPEAPVGDGEVEGDSERD